MTRRILPLALAFAAVTAPAASAFEKTITVEPLGCTATVAVTDVIVYLSNPPKFGTSGPTGVWVSCT